jgi:hypothetical protein
MLGKSEHIKVFISIPFRGRTNAEIEKSIIRFGNRIRTDFAAKKVTILHNFIFEKAPAGVNESIWFLGKALGKLAEADCLVYINDAGTSYKGCEIEKQTALNYGMPVIGMSTLADICPDLIK